MPRKSLLLGSPQFTHGSMSLRAGGVDDARSFTGSGFAGFWCGRDDFDGAVTVDRELHFVVRQACAVGVAGEGLRRGRLAPLK